MSTFIENRFIKFSLLFVFERILLFPTAAFAPHVQIKPARYWVETLYISCLSPLLLFLLLFLLEIPIFFFVETWFFLITILMCRRCRVIFLLFLFWFNFRFTFREGHWFLLYSFPDFLDMIINYLRLLALKCHFFQFF